jgi:tyrosyl-tRNA synthetase
MQIGGSDQYGNIVAGIDAIKYISAHHPDPDVRKGKDIPSAQPVGFTVPLLTTSSGAKFGKSVGNAIWLDKEQTSSYDLYGFFVRQPDADVGRYLRLFTFLPVEKIDAVVEEHMKAPHERKAQHLLAREFVELVHGVEEAKDAEMRHRMLFSKPVDALEVSKGRESKFLDEKAPVTLNNAPQANIRLPTSLIHHKSIGRILYAAGFASSSSEGHRMVTAGSVYIGGMPGQKKAMSDAAVSFTPVKLWKNEETANFLVDGNLLILRKGKHNIRIIEVVTDEEWKQSGMKYAGEELDEAKERQRLLTEESKKAQRSDRGIITQS